MSPFSGFPEGKLAYTPLPDMLFSELLPELDDLSELRVTLHVLWLTCRRKGARKYVTEGELLADPVLRRGFHGSGSTADEDIRQGLRRAVARGTLLTLVADQGSKSIFFVNTALGRRAFDQALAGTLDQIGEVTPIESVDLSQRANIFTLYEQNIGLLQPIIAEELQEAEQLYPQDWIAEAFRLAVEANVRSWRYIRRILERWASEGKDKGRSASGEKTWYTQDEYERLVRH